MSYFAPNEKSVLRIIKRITLEKPYTHSKQVFEAVPKKWKLNGCGTGNIDNCLVQLYRKGFITTASQDLAFFQGTYVGNKIFHLTPKGDEKLQPFYRKVNFWFFIFTAITAISTLGTLLSSFLL